MMELPSLGTASTANALQRVATELWPQHAEMCSAHDWAVISQAVVQDRPLTKSIVEPVGEAKDAVLASLMILYWTMKLAQLVIQVSKDVGDLHGAEKAKAVIEAVAKRTDSNTPKIVSDRLHEIVANIQVQ